MNSPIVFKSALPDDIEVQFRTLDNMDGMVIQDFPT